MWAQAGRTNFEIARCVAVAGIFGNRLNAYQAIRELKDSGFTDQQIGFVMDDEGGRWAETLERDMLPARGIAMSNIEALKAGGALASAFSLSSPARSTVAQVLVSRLLPVR